MKKLNFCANLLISLFIAVLSVAIGSATDQMWIAGWLGGCLSILVLNILED